MKNNKYKTTLILLLIFIFVSLSLFGCKRNIGPGPDDIEQIDPDRTQLYVANFNGGVGKEWLEALKKRFENDYKDKSFEKGKTGVQIIMTSSEKSGFCRTFGMFSDIFEGFLGSF